VLKSWAVPKGLPYEQGRVRGAFQTEDHPLDYIDFEGVIPRGQYGGGTVMVWDTGSYELVDGNYGKGQLLVRLNGKKLRGEWKLVRKGGADAKAEWLLIKAHEDARPPGARAEAKSVLSGRTLEQIARAPDSVWESAGGS
jgi:bifunctional non-homologous end joining protein LigD